MDDLDRRILQALQDGLPLVPEPYGAVAGTLGISPEVLLERLRGMLGRGEVRRMGASIAHRAAGFAANAMCVWRVPAEGSEGESEREREEEVEAFGRLAATFDEVTHCYDRAGTPPWPYNVYAMIHGRTKADCEAVIRRICERTGQTHYVALYSTREFKKTWTRL